MSVCQLELSVQDTFHYILCQSVQKERLSPNLEIPSSVIPLVL